MKKYLIWDFDGTLGYRSGPHPWVATAMEVIEQFVPDHAVEVETLRPHMRRDFPWHQPEVAHPHIASADQWWAELFPVVARAFQAVGFSPTEAQAMAPHIRPAFTNLARWRLFEDTGPTLQTLAAQGWTHLVLSNHVPELDEIISHLGLTPHLGQVFNSANIGYEKPHPAAFQRVLESLVEAEQVWMIGDNIHADVGGGEAAGIPAILVRRYDETAKIFCETLAEVPAVVNGSLGDPISR